MTRVQKERFGDIAAYEAVKDAFIFDVGTVEKMHSKAILMHPLPRVNEISLEVDSLPQSRYFEQAQN
jgi:aspartate carbamoyltransferase catalytic subunit